MMEMNRQNEKWQSGISHGEKWQNGISHSEMKQSGISHSEMGQSGVSHGEVGQKVIGVERDEMENRDELSRNEMSIRFDSYSVNEGFARVAVAAFLADLDPTLDELADVKTAVSEAVTNSIIHGYDNRIGKIYLTCAKEKQQIQIEVVDYGKGIEDVAKAKEPFYTTRPELERSGMGFAFMEAFMDDVEVNSAPGQGTTVRMIKQLGAGA